MDQKYAKMFLVFKIIGFEPGSINSHNPEEHSCHCQSKCYQATLRFNI